MESMSACVMMLRGSDMMVGVYGRHPCTHTYMHTNKCVMRVGKMGGGGASELEGETRRQWRIQYIHNMLYAYMKLSRFKP